MTICTRSKQQYLLETKGETRPVFGCPGGDYFSWNRNRLLVAATAMMFSYRKKIMSIHCHGTKCRTHHAPPAPASAIFLPKKVAKAIFSNNLSSSLTYAPPRRSAYVYIIFDLSRFPFLTTSVPDSDPPGSVTSGLAVPDPDPAFFSNIVVLNLKLGGLMLAYFFSLVTNKSDCTR